MSELTEKDYDGFLLYEVIRCQDPYYKPYDIVIGKFKLLNKAIDSANNHAKTYLESKSNYTQYYYFYIKGFYFEDSEITNDKKERNDKIVYELKSSPDVYLDLYKGYDYDISSDSC